jgi:heavy metal sensor kinase
MSGRALAPVDRITRDARSITASNLSHRLAVPRAKDELQRLSETLNQMLDRIETSFNQVRQFTADASHELRAPLTLIHTAAEFSLRRERGRDDLVEALRKVLRESKRTAHMVDDLLLLARADSDKNGFESAPLDLQPVLKDVSEQAVLLAESKGIEVAVEIANDSIEVQGDESSLRRLFLILIDNAIKYTPVGGKVGIGLRRELGQATIQVRDNGIGIASEDLPRIFDRFWRADKVRSRDAGGAGLGLSIANWIVEKHGGTLTVESELGGGSVFSVRLPGTQH